MPKVCKLSFDEEIVKTGSEKYIAIVDEIATNGNFSKEHIYLSSLSLSLAFGEAAKDIEAIKSRRNPEEISVAYTNKYVNQAA